MIGSMTRRCGGRWLAAVLAGLMVWLGMGFMPLAGRGVARAAVGPGPKIYVFPYQPIRDGASKEVVTQIGDLLKNEIKHSDEVQLQKGPIFIPETTGTPVKPLSDRELKQAEKLRRAGDKHYQAFRFGKAIRSYQAALARYQKSLALLSDFTPVIEALLMLSVCYYRTDREDDGAKMLVKVIRLKPDIVLDPERYPPMFRNVAEGIRKKLLLKSRGELEVLANVEGATVFFDGRKVGTTPILMKELVPGEHFLRVEKEGLQPWADKVTVVSTQRRRVLASLGGVKKLAGPLGEIAQSLRQNRVQKATIKLARKEGRKIGADYVVLGGVGNIGNNLVVGSFLMKVADGQLCPLPAVQLDKDLLGASVEVYNMATVLVKRVEGCPDPVKKFPALLIASRQQKKKLKSVAVGPVAPPPAPRQPAGLPVAPAVKKPPAAPVRGPAVPSARGPAVPGARATPAKPPATVQPAAPRVTREGLVTAGGSALAATPTTTTPVVVPVPVAQSVKPIDEIESHGPRWYQAWWFWTLVGVVVAGGTAGGLYAAGVFNQGAGGASVNVHWPVP